jgi:hypothetical protein
MALTEAQRQCGGPENLEHPILRKINTLCIGRHGAWSTVRCDRCGTELDASILDGYDPLEARDANA